LKVAVAPLVTQSGMSPVAKQDGPPAQAKTSDSKLGLLTVIGVAEATPTKPSIADREADIRTRIWSSSSVEMIFLFTKLIPARQSVNKC
jgi:hypothetical protein